MNKELDKYKWTDKAAVLVAGWLVALQRGFASALARRTAGFSKQRLKKWLLLFCCCWGGWSVYLTIRAIVQEKPVIKVDGDRVTFPIHLDDVDAIDYGMVIDEETYRQIQHFRSSTLFDSTVLARPGLLDSITLLEQFYHSQNRVNENK
jgi:hypothetical protein